MGFPGVWMTESESMVYRVVPKCACSTIGQIMFYSDHGRFLDGDIHDSTTGLHKWSQGDSQPLIDKAVRAHKALTYTCVRNPYNRILSSFFDKIAGIQRNGRRYRGNLVPQLIQRYGVDVGSPENGFEFDQVALSQGAKTLQLGAMGKDLALVSPDDKAVLLAPAVPLDDAPLTPWARQQGPAAGAERGNGQPLALLFGAVEKADATTLTVERFILDIAFLVATTSHGRFFLFDISAQTNRKRPIRSPSRAKLELYRQHSGIRPVFGETERSWEIGRIPEC